MPRRKGEWRGGVRLASAEPAPLAHSAPAAAPAAAVAVETAVSTEASRPLWNRDPNKMAGRELRDHARAIGITQRDAECLSEDRLRANCALHTVEYLNALAEA